MQITATLGRVYGGAPELVHIKDGQRQSVGAQVADYIDALMRHLSGADHDTALCPGCYMVALYNAALTLAERNGQSKAELCRSMARAFSELESNPRYYREEIYVCVE